MSKNRDQELLNVQAERVRTNTRSIAAHLREMADRIDRIANREEIDRIPSVLVHELTWGMADAHVDNVLNAHIDYVEYSRIVAASDGKADGGE